MREPAPVVFVVDDDPSIRDALTSLLGEFPMAELAALRQRYAALTPRERDVMQGVVAGRFHKQIAAELGTSAITITLHRGQVMHKMGAAAVGELVRMAERLGLPAPRY
jgi:FixJ family two-component response regulator